MSDLIETPAAATASVTGTTRKTQRAVFAGYTGPQLVAGAAALALIVWSMWVTHALMASGPQQHIVKANLSGIVSDYIQAQARSATPPAQVEAQMREFMASLDSELQRRGAAGQVVLVGEAVLSTSVPDITSDVVKAVYASGVKLPQPASPQQMGATLGMQGPAPVQVPPVQEMQVPVAAPAADMASAFDQMADPVQVAPGTMAGPQVSAFGGPYGQ